MFTHTLSVTPAAHSVGAQPATITHSAVQSNDARNYCHAFVCTTGIRYQASGILSLPGEPLAKGYYKWQPEKKGK